jgi:hypothetical protein
MYCSQCGQLVSVGLFGYFVHDYSTHDAHTPIVEDDNGDW